MIDLNWTESTFGIAFTFLISFAIYVMYFYRQYGKNQKWSSSKINKILILFSLILIVVVSENSGSDWYHYQQLVKEYDFTFNARNYGEPVYGYIIQLVDKNYLMFRLAVWGTAFFLTCLAFKRFDVNVNVAVYLIVSCFLLKYNYSRSTLAMASYFLGLSFLLKPMKGKIFSLILVSLLFWGSYEFHHSFFPVLFLTVVAFIPFKRPFIVILLLLLLPYFATLISSQFVILDSFDDEYMLNKLENYLARESEEMTLYGIIQNIISYGAFVVPLILISIVVFKKNRIISLPMLRLWRVMLAISMFAASFLFMGLMSMLFTYRYLYMTFIPITILTVYLYQNKLISKLKFNIILFCGVISNMYALLYNIYKLA